jgi:hypothetical protein
MSHTTSRITNPLMTHIIRCHRTDRTMIRTIIQFRHHHRIMIHIMIRIVRLDLDPDTVRDVIRMTGNLAFA